MNSTNSQTQHTPGPWEARGESIWRYGSTDFIANAVPAFTSVTLEHYANARLIAAAPELLEVLQILRHELREVAASFSAIGQSKAMERAWANVRVIDAAIAKAEGRT